MTAETKSLSVEGVKKVVAEIVAHETGCFWPGIGGKCIEAIASYLSTSPEEMIARVTEFPFLVDRLSDNVGEKLRLSSENEKLREALRPFAHAASLYDGFNDPSAGACLLSDHRSGLGREFTVGDLQRARAVLTEGD